MCLGNMIMLLIHCIIYNNSNSRTIELNMYSILYYVIFLSLYYFIVIYIFAMFMLYIIIIYYLCGKNYNINIIIN